MTDNENNDDFSFEKKKKGITSFEKLSKQQWAQIEKELSPFNADIAKMLCDLGKGTESVIKYNLQTLNDETYLQIRDKLVDHKLVKKEIPKVSESNNNNNDLIDGDQIITTITDKVCTILEQKGIKHNVNNVNATVTKIASNYGVVKVTNKSNIKIKQAKGKNIKKGVTKEQIIMKNTLSTIQKSLDDLIAKMDTRSGSGFASSLVFGFRSTYAEIRLITFLCFISNYLQNANINSNATFESPVYELIIGITKVLNGLRENQKKGNLVKLDVILHESLAFYNCADLKDPQYIVNKIKYVDYSMFNNISSILCADVEEMKLTLQNKIKFKFEKVFSSYPKLCISTIYDTVFPSINIKPYASQEELITKLRTLLRGLFLYRTSVGSGKTSNSVAVASFVQWLRACYSNKPDDPCATKQLLFSCSVEPVRNEVGRLMYNSKIPFAVASFDYDKRDGVKKLKITNSWMCKKDPCPVVIIADLEATYELLKEKKNADLEKNKRNYILYLDEPTVGADQPNHPITNIIMRILSCMPETTILSSATLPELKELLQVVTLYSMMYPEYAGNVYDIYSKDSLIGCQIITDNGNNIVPYYGCQNSEELSTIIKYLKEEPFIDRLLSAPLVYDLSTAMKQERIKGVINLEEYFSTCQNLCQTEIQRVAIKLLVLLSTCEDRIIEKICSRTVNLSSLHENYNDEDNNISQNNNNLKEEDDDIWDSDSSSEDESSNASLPYDINGLFTTTAHRYVGPCLVAVNEPYEFAYKMSRELLKGSRTASEIIQEYHDNMIKYEDEKDKINKMKNKDDREKRLTALEKNKPSLRFPRHLRVNTVEHFKKFAPKVFKKGSVKLNSLILSHSLEDLPLDLDIQDWIMLLLFAGIGIYAPNDEKLENRIYNSLVLDLASSGSLAFLISNSSICYGANYPFSHLLVGSDLIRTHSKNTYWQLVGRTGRVFCSWTSTVVIFNDSKDTIYKYVQHKEPVTVEALNMIAALERIREQEAERKRTKVATEEVARIYFYKPALDGTEGTDVEIKNTDPNPPFEVNDELDTIWEDSLPSKTVDWSTGLDNIVSTKTIDWSAGLDINKSKPINTSNKTNVSENKSALPSTCTWGKSNSQSNNNQWGRSNANTQNRQSIQAPNGPTPTSTPVPAPAWGTNNKRQNDNNNNNNNNNNGSWRRSNQ
jgi:hypothetical protein